MVSDAPARAVALEPPTGWQFVLERPRQRTVVTEVGAALRSWCVDGRERLDTFPVGSPGEGCGKVLAPHADTDHGLVAWVNWRPLRRGSDRLTLGYVLHPQPGYPFTVSLEVEYALAPEGLVAGLRATNLGAEPAPFAAGFRPCVRAERWERRGAGVVAGDLALWTDAGLPEVRAEPASGGVVLTPLTADAALAPGETLCGRWGLTARGLC
jgi:aldose 1-epimerase